ncbi:MAG: BTAD domain-containing putative transcriptional regulator [Gemmatimonadota bacterium]|nr:BTAD domain-containing putative transcriptional regulator [Gemmatimonadota bacterium]
MSPDDRNAADGTAPFATARARAEGGARLRLLGLPVLEGVDGTAAAELLAQPKRLAVLAFLAVEASGEGKSREAIAGVFWPDRPARLARASLRNTLHYLRTRLGPGTFRSRGDTLEVDTAALACDVSAFRAHLAAGRPGEALALYEGDLLTGLDSAGPPQWSRWIETERDRLRRSAAVAAWLLAEREEERCNWISAVDHARHAVALSADEEAAVRRLMRLLERAGDGVAALREYARLRQQWRREHGVAPSQRTRSLAEEIRRRADEAAEGSRRPGPVGRSRPATEDEPVGKIAVLPFVQTGSSGGLEPLGSGITHGLIASLARLTGILVVARTSVDRFGGSPGAVPRAHVADALGVTTILQGSIGLAGPRIVVSAQLADARSGLPLWAEIYECEVDDVQGIQGEMLDGILEVLGVRLSPGDRARLPARPAAPEAFDAYVEGRHRLARRAKEDLEEAVRLFESAVALDPRFALAHASLAEASLLLWPIAGVRRAEARVRAREAARSALAADPRLGEAHATLGLVTGLLDRDRAGAEAHFRRAIELSPGSATTRHWYGAYLAYAMRRPDEAERELGLALELDPLSPIIRTDQGLARWHRGDLDGAMKILRAVLDDAPAFWRAHHDLGLAMFASGDPEGGAEHLRLAWRHGAWGGTLSAPEGPPADWSETLDHRLEDLASRSRRHGTLGIEGALLAALLDRYEEVLRWFEVLAEEGSSGLLIQYWPVFEHWRDRPDFAARLDEQGLAWLSP